MYKVAILARAVPAAFTYSAEQRPRSAGRGDADRVRGTAASRAGGAAPTARARARGAAPAPDSPLAAPEVPREMHAARRLIDKIDWEVAQPRLIALGATGLAVLVGSTVLAATAPWALLGVAAGGVLAVVASFLFLAIRHELRAPRERPLDLGAGDGFTAAMRAWRQGLDAAVNWALPERLPDPATLAEHLVTDFEGTVRDVARDGRRYAEKGVARFERFLARCR